MISPVAPSRDPIARVFEALGAWSPFTHAAVSATLLAAMIVLDLATGGRFSLSLLYLLPLTIAGWYTQRWFNVVLATAAGFAWFIDTRSAVEGASTFVWMWGCFSRVLFLLSVVWLIGVARAMHDRQRALAWTDEVTQIPNRRAFHAYAAREIARASRAAKPMTTIFLDVDHFKRINDRLGHAAGDRLLFTIAQTLNDNCRTTDMVARLGGDEFVVLLPETDEVAAGLVAKKLRDALSQSMNILHFPVTFSIGVATFPIPPATPEELLSRADSLQYHAKRSGKNTIVTNTVAA